MFSQGEGLHTPHNSNERCKSLHDIVAPESLVSQVAYNREESTGTPHNPTQSRSHGSEHSSYGQIRVEGMKTKLPDIKSYQGPTLEIRKVTS